MLKENADKQVKEKEERQLRAEEERCMPLHRLNKGMLLIDKVISNYDMVIELATSHHN